jgi:uncharacterized membrane protein YGL010W
VKKNMFVYTIYNKWAARHTCRTNFLLHVLGIPLTIAALPALVLGSFRPAVVLFITGYVLQLLGHAIEGNKAGEQILLEKLLRREKGGKS